MKEEGRTKYINLNCFFPKTCKLFLNGNINIFQGKRSSDDRSSCARKIEVPQICLLQEELEGEDFIFRTSIDDDDS